MAIKFYLNLRQNRIDLVGYFTQAFLFHLFSISKFGLHDSKQIIESKNYQICQLLETFLRDQLANEIIFLPNDEFVCF